MNILTTTHKITISKHTQDHNIKPHLPKKTTKKSPSSRRTLQAINLKTNYKSIIYTTYICLKLIMQNYNQFTTPTTTKTSYFHQPPTPFRPTKSISSHQNTTIHHSNKTHNKHIYNNIRITFTTSKPNHYFSL